MAVLAVSATASEPQVEYFKDGDVGVFAAVVSLSKDVDLATTTFSAKSTDDRIYLLYVDSPQRLHEQAAVNLPEEPDSFHFQRIKSQFAGWRHLRQIPTASSIC